MQIGKIYLLLGISVAFIAMSHGAIGSEFIEIEYPPGTVNFSIDSKAQIFADRSLWKVLRSDQKNIVYVGQLNHLQDHAVEVIKNGQGELRSVIATQVPDEGFVAGANSTKKSIKDMLKDGWDVVWGSSPPSPRIPHMTIASIEENQVTSQTKCANQICFTVTPSYCQAILRESNAIDYFDLAEKTFACRKIEDAWGKALNNQQVQEELTNAYKKNMEKLNDSGLISKVHSPAFGDISNMFSRFPVNDPYTSALFKVIVQSCVKLNATSKHFAVKSAGFGTTKSGAGAATAK